MGQTRQEELEQGYREEAFTEEAVRSIREGKFWYEEGKGDLSTLIYNSYHNNHFTEETNRGLTPQEWLDLEVGNVVAKEKFCKTVTEQDLIDFVRRELV